MNMIVMIIKICILLGLYIMIQSCCSCCSCYCYAMATTTTTSKKSSSKSTTTTTTLNTPRKLHNRHLNLHSDNIHIDDSISTTSSSSSSSCCCGCRSNSTHIVWRQYNRQEEEEEEEQNKNKNDENNHNEQVKQKQRQRNLNSDDVVNNNYCSCSCIWETIDNAKQLAYQYLYDNIMPFDSPFLSTLGFHNNNNDTNNNIDGLSNGLIGYTIDYAFRTKILFKYTDEYTKDIFYEYILNYVNMNEPRTNWRPILWKQLIQPLLLVSNNNTIIENLNVTNVITILNTNMWKLLSPNKSSSCSLLSDNDDNTNINEIIFVSGQAPAILDPMSTMIYGYSSCSGLSILLVSALRTAGIPSRVVGTAAWYQNDTAGNHNWIEIYYNNTWNYFIESKPAALYIDTISNDYNPCKHWFCNINRFNYNNHNTTHVYAARYTRTTVNNNTNNSTYFPLAWEISNHDVPGENRTLYYQNICSQCK